MLFARLRVRNEATYDSGGHLFWLEIPVTSLETANAVAAGIELGVALGGGECEVLDIRLSKHKTETTLNYQQARELLK